DTVQLANKPFRLAKVKDTDLTARREYAIDLLKPTIVVREITKPKGRSHQLKLSRHEGQIKSVGLNPTNRFCSRLLLGTYQHGVRKVGAYQFGSSICATI